MDDQMQVRLIYKKLLESWNNNNANEYAGLFTDEANLIGFDGSQMNGRDEIYKQISEIFATHKVASYISIVREVRPLCPTVFVLTAVAGMVPPNGTEINPAVNAIQTLIAVKQKEEFKIAVFQNTPAAFHGRPELSKQLTGELQKTFTETKNTP